MSTQNQEIPSQFSNLMGMGAPEGIFKGKVTLAVRLIFSIILGLGGAAALLYALWLLWERWGRYYPPAIFQAMLPWLIVAGVAFLLVAVLMWGWYTRKKKAIVVYANGFAHSDRKGVTVWRWDQINDIYANVVRHYTNGIYTGTTHTYTLYDTQGSKLILNDAIQDVDQLFGLIQNHSLQPRYQKLAGAYNTGNVVSFGPVKISKQGGLQIGKKLYGWNEIEQVAIQKGILSVKKKDGGWFSGASATSGSIPNLQVLLSILDQVIGIKTG